MEIIIDKTIPENAEALKGCKAGDTITGSITSDDDAECRVDIEYSPSADNATPENEDQGGSGPAGEPEPEPEPEPAGNPAVATMMRRKRKA